MQWSELFIQRFLLKHWLFFRCQKFQRKEFVWKVTSRKLTSTFIAPQLLSGFFRLLLSSKHSLEVRQLLQFQLFLSACSCQFFHSLQFSISLLHIRPRSLTSVNSWINCKWNCAKELPSNLREWCEYKLKLILKGKYFNQCFFILLFSCSRLFGTCLWCLKNWLERRFGELAFETSVLILGCE